MRLPFSPRTTWFPPSILRHLWCLWGWQGLGRTGLSGYDQGIQILPLLDLCFNLFDQIMEIMNILMKPTRENDETNASLWVYVLLQVWSIPFLGAIDVEEKAAFIVSRIVHLKL